MAAGSKAAAAIRAACLALLCAGCTSIHADARTFEGTRWHVSAINGRATPARGDYQMEFRQGRLSARFGCNSIGGQYSIRGKLLEVLGLTSTMMACPEPAMGFESAASTLFDEPVLMHWNSARQLRLVNRRGTIDLELSR